MLKDGEPRAPGHRETPKPGDRSGGGNPAHTRMGGAGRGRWAAGIFVFLVVTYSLNGDFLPGNDATANVYLPVSLLDHGTITYSPRELPFKFLWRGAHLTQEGQPKTAAPASLQDYFLIRSIQPGVYVNTFGIGAGLTAVPVFAVLKLLGHDPGADPTYLWYGGKIVASLLVAGSAAFVFLAACYFCRKRLALILAIAYGLGTCVWSISSQTLWQHGPAEFFLALGAWLLIRSRQYGTWSTLWCGSALGAAVLCRPTCAVVVMTVAIFLFMVDRKGLLKFVVGGLPLAVLLALYNYHYLGSPFAFGQTVEGAVIAMHKTGSPDLWQTPLWEGAAGLLFSPSRGLFVYSPFLIVSLISLPVIFREPRYQVLLPLAAGAAAMMVIAFKWFDWWGGWSYGYRPLVDTMPLVILLAAPLLDRVLENPWRRALFGALMAWSVIVQVLGAFAYDSLGWNNRTVYEAVFNNRETRRFAAASDAQAVARAREMNARKLLRGYANIDLPANRYRLWSVTDNEIIYYLTHFWIARRSKKEQIQNWLKIYSIRLKDSGGPSSP